MPLLNVIAFRDLLIDPPGRRMRLSLGHSIEFWSERCVCWEIPAVRTQPAFVPFRYNGLLDD